ncbi:tetratricopeptide repeat protein [Streptomyces sp. NPDC006430]|uniref:tetratricopeptide repeat protein n=1 Tax=Streptomyces sp. NPDC006430 TaxID=3154299 RepID=UPI0033B87999
MSGNLYHGPTAFIAGDNGTLNAEFVYQWKPAYRVEGFPTTPRPVRPRILADQPSRLLRAAHQVVPFTGRRTELDKLAGWRDDPQEHLAIRLLHGPGGQGKSRLAARFAGLSGEMGWTVWQAVVNETGADALGTSPLPRPAAGILVVVDYAERWPVQSLRDLLREPLLHRTGVPVRILLLARPSGAWWDSLETWIGDELDASAGADALQSLADDPQSRGALFRQARDRFADHLGLPAEQAARIGPPAELATDKDYAQVLTIHIAALAAVDARLHDDAPPTDPARASAYLLKRERAYWTALHRPPADLLSTGPDAMGRAVLTATLTGPVVRANGWDALRRIGLADSREAANTLLDHHRYCYPPTGGNTVLEPLYPDRLGEDFLGLSTPAAPDSPHPVRGAVVDDWADQAARRLLADVSGSTAASWTRAALTVLIETARRWPHVATGQLFPLLREHPELALHAGGPALAGLAGLDSIEPAVLEAIEPLLPEGRHSELDVGAAAVVHRLTRHRLATTRNPLVRARLHDNLSVRLHLAGLRSGALAAAETAVRTWRDLAGNDPAHLPGLAGSLANLSVQLSAVGRRAEALVAGEEAVDLYRRLSQVDPARHEPGLAYSLTHLGDLLRELGRRDEGLVAGQEAVTVHRRLERSDPAAHEPGLAAALSHLGIQLAVAGRRAEALVAGSEAVEILRRLARDDPSAHDPGLAHSLSHLGVLLSRAGRWTEALASEREAMDIRRRLTALNPAAHEPDLAGSLVNFGNRLSQAALWTEAISATEEAVAIYRQLEQDDPYAYTSEFAGALTNLGALLSQAGRWVEALVASGEALDVRLRLALDNPAAHEPDLAAALSNLGMQLARAGRSAEALASERQAVVIRRRLAAEDPVAHEPDLARSLTHLGDRLMDAGQAGEAYAATEEAVSVYRRLARDEPAAHGPELARALSNLGGQLLQAGRRSEALACERQAAQTWRRLALDDPATHTPNLARYLTAHAVFLCMVQDLSGALRATGEAVDIFRGCVATAPVVLPQLHFALGFQADLLDLLGRPQDARQVREWLLANPVPPDPEAGVNGPPAYGR